MTPEQIQAQINTVSLDLAQAKGDLVLAQKTAQDAQARVDTLQATVKALEARLAQLQSALQTATATQTGAIQHRRRAGQYTSLTPNPPASWSFTTSGERLVSGLPPGPYTIEYSPGNSLSLTVAGGQTTRLDTTVTPPQVVGPGAPAPAPAPAPQPSVQPAMVALPQLPASTIVPGVLAGLHNADHPDGSTDEWMHPFMLDKYFHEYLRPDWKTIEPSQGSYNWASLDAAVEGARSRGRTAGLGITPFQERWDFSSTPDYIPHENGMLAWNSETYVQGQINLWRALGARYASNPWVEWVDARGWGAYGENNNYPHVNPPMTLANKKRIIEAMFQAFPASSPVILLAMTDDYEATDYMIQRAIELGMRWKAGKRRDSYSNKSGPKPWGFNWYDEDGRPQTAEQWRYAPVLVESWGPFNNFADQDWDKAYLQSQQFHISAYKDQNHGHKYGGWTGPTRQMWERVLAEQAGYRLTALEMSLPSSVRVGEQLPVTLKWQNSGNAPLYRDYRVQLFYVSNGNVQPAVTSSVNLRALGPGETTTVTDSLPTGGLAAGSYELRLRAVDAAGVRKPLRFALQNHLSDDSYSLGTVSLT
jgi:hypothetical protein